MSFAAAYESRWGRFPSLLADVGNHRPLMDSYGIPVSYGRPTGPVYHWDSDNVRKTYNNFEVPWEDWRPQLPIKKEAGWKTEKMRIFVQERGGGDAKQHPFWHQIANYFNPFGEVIYLDRRECRKSSILDGLAAAKSCDRFIGWDSGPLYAALAGGCRAYAVFPYGQAENIAASLGGRLQAAQCRNPLQMPISTFLREIIAHFGIDEPMSFGANAEGLFFLGDNCHGHLYSGHEDWLKPYLTPKPGEVCADVGAHIGNWTCWMARTAERVYSFEPSPGPGAARKKTASVRGLENIVFADMAISSGEGVTTVSRDRGGSYIGAEQGDEAQVTTLDRYFAGMDRLDLIKIDTEGAEARILEGGTETLRRLRPRLIVEVHQFAAGRFDADPYRAIANVLFAAGYRFKKIGGGLDNFYLEAFYGKD